ncbi:TolC family protein [Microbulbifer hainanensis]|uniref:TolC family protein n=1 Tax=Microbulbifer hainanensis TaxID=2735675 RepID=UPI001865EC9C|nr:TolC family protein [Microbulbifer hainanensis]
MKRMLLRQLLCTCLIGLCLPAAAAMSSRDKAWADWLLGQIERHPEIAAAREHRQRGFALGDAREQPLYNPELATEIEREGDDDNYRIGIAQTLDIWDKRALRRDQGGEMRSAAHWQYLLVLQRRTATILRALANWRAARARNRLADEQESQLEQFAALLEKRRRAGDLGSADIELALLSLSRQLNQAAAAAAEFQSADAALNELLPDWSPARAPIPDTIWQLPAPPDPTQNLDGHPRWQLARARWAQLQQQARLQQLQRRADPTIGINGGRKEEHGVVALTFSMPLNIRNNYSAEARAADSAALGAEADYLAERRALTFACKSAAAILSGYRERYQRWRELAAGRGERSRILLEKQWRSGDMNTTDYLQALQQRREGLLAGIELERNYRLAVIDWLEQSGRIDIYLQRIAGQEEGK